MLRDRQTGFVHRNARAADTLWSRHGGADHRGFNVDFAGDYDDWVATTTHLAELLLAGR